ncbi:MAG: PLP-dependent aspartate aminotransferase family protein [Gemmatimonadota bacterium]|nr:PLP-dependent aspartate aminotransferase family protein [Gemmatimonadota bacterium]
MSDASLSGCGFSTRAVHAGEPAPTRGGPVTNPVVHSSTFFSDPEGEGEVRYARYGNGPNTVALERRIAALEGTDDCVATGSGMAALACALLACVRAGDHVVAAAALYGGTRTLLDRELSRLGVRTTYVDLQDPSWTGALCPETRVVLAEIPSNPLLRIPDLPAIAGATAAHGTRLLVDATFATPVNLRPCEHGADLVIHSATKYLGGHSDVTAGAVAGGEELVGEVRARSQVWGPMLDAHAAWLVERGIKTLALRMERHNRNSLELARWLEEQPAVARVHHPGLASHPDHGVAGRLLDGFGGMLSVEVRGGGAAATRFVRALRLAKLAPSLGGVETLVSEPRHTSHAAMSPEERTVAGMPDGLVRFSIGIEDAADLRADIRQALDAADRG